MATLPMSLLPFFLSIIAHGDALGLAGVVNIKENKVPKTEVRCVCNA